MLLVVEVAGWVPPEVIAAELTRWWWWTTHHAVMNMVSQLFDIFASYPTNPYKSPGEMVPLFTIAQWKELERQALIYKYMIFSVPVPPHLLYPPLLSSLSSLCNVGYSKNGAVLEARRCKRTDGKKWRCSRDVAPHQKYCERHLHRGHPRSRKPVEEVNNENDGDVKNHKKPRLEKNPRQFTSVNDDHPLLLFNATTDLNSIYTNRDLALMMESEMATNNGDVQKWHHFMESNTGFADEGLQFIDLVPFLVIHWIMFYLIPICLPMLQAVLSITPTTTM